MTTLRWPEGRGTFVERDVDRNPDDGDVPLRIRPGTTVDVDDSDTVDHYLDRGFVRVESKAADGDADDADGSDDPDTGDGAKDDSSDDTDAEQAEDFDVDGFEDVDDFVDRTPVSDVVEDVEAGVVDAHLQAVADADGRVTVERAVESRRDEIGGS